MDAEKTDAMLKELLRDASDANVTEERLQSLDMIDPNVDFYMLGLKPILPGCRSNLSYEENTQMYFGILQNFRKICR